MWMCKIKFLKFYWNPFFKLGFTCLVTFCSVNTGIAQEKDVNTQISLQKSLNFFGFSAGPADGVLGPKTQNAISDMQSCLLEKKSGALSKASQEFLIESYQIAKAQQLSGSCALLKAFVNSVYQCPPATWTQLFSCSFSSENRVATVCGSGEQARFRLGRKGRMPELSILQPLKDIYVPWMGIGRYKNEAIAFKKSGEIYKIYTSKDRLSDDIYFSAGIDIIQSDKIITSMTCDEESVEAAIPEASNLLERFGQCWNRERGIWGPCQKKGGWGRFIDGPVFPYEAYQLGEFFSPCEKTSENTEIQGKAYEFGLYLQELVRTKDLASLYDNVKGPLISGPEKEMINGRSFDDFFSKNWRETALNIEPECEPVGFRGYMIGRGLIWFDIERHQGNGKSKNSWTIISINNDLTP